MIRDIVSVFLDVLIPPRRTELLLRGLSPSTLRGLAQDEELPYRDARVQALVWEVKYYGSRRAARLCAPLLAERLLGAAQEELGMPLLIPIPMHALRRRERGHNQTELLCQEAIRELDEAALLDYAPHALRRVVHTRTQQGLPKQERLTNVKHSMAADPLVAGRACIVLDDVATTGATLQEARRALRHAGARAVHAIALARS